MIPPPPITIKDIARQFNCSPSTVSRALNDHYTISEDTRRSIQQYAQQAGYQRNLVSLSLLNKLSGTLGIIVPTISDSYESSVIEGLHTALRPMGYSLTICVTGESRALEAEYVLRLLANRVEGIFLSVAQETYDSGHYDHLAMVTQRQLPLVLIDRDYASLPVSRVTADDYHGAWAVVEHLIQVGCRRIAHLRGPAGLTVSEQRFAGYIDCLTQHGLPICDELILPTNFKIDSAVLPTQQLLNLPTRPDAIFGVNDQVAIGAMRVLRERGLRIPDDVAVAGFDDSPTAAYTCPSLTTVARSGQKLSAEAARLFLQHKQTPGHTPIESVVLPAQLIVRESSQRVG
ncbi:LacI family DNA-binding transcriptional regulator [Spirosoma rhododendri]|uniref:LacI family transcriptional regulator n=1 Tax=Spirosoma rhododendri TaxID=2728024 RepID=A0A7L5DQE7_9BACT|nr:LacI family DNA-binding transcriptional regulator [Spirosoma rhododendri]QJD79802.1 LacI family transcriptional regulator [Spirosoma rhododendri]